jgi:hypothetical protein
MSNGVGWHINSEQSAKYLYEHVLRRLSEGREVFLSEKEGTRTTDQNSALHALLRRLAAAMNESGYDVKKFLAEAEGKLDIPWTEQAAKEILIRPVIDVMWTKKSTTQLTKSELSESVEVILARVAEITGVTVDGLEGPR